MGHSLALALALCVVALAATNARADEDAVVVDHAAGEALVAPDAAPPGGTDRATSAAATARGPCDLVGLPSLPDVPVTAPLIAGAGGAFAGFLVGAGAASGLIFYRTRVGGATESIYAVLGAIGLVTVLPAAAALLATIPFVDAPRAIVTSLVVLNLAPLLGGGMAVAGVAAVLLVNDGVCSSLGNLRWICPAAAGTIAGAVGAAAAGWVGGWTAELALPGDEGAP